MFYEIKMTRMGMDGNGNNKKLTELYVVNALSIIEAATTFESKISDFYAEHDTLAVKKVNISEIMTDEAADNRYFRAKINIITINEITGKEKKSTTVILIQANDYDDAKGKYEEMTKDWLVDKELASLSETKIVDYFLV